MLSRSSDRRVRYPHPCRSGVHVHDATGIGENSRPWPCNAQTTDLVSAVLRRFHFDGLPTIRPSGRRAGISEAECWRESV